MTGTSTHTSQLHSQAPGKLILLGEYAVLRGAPALVMAVNRHAHVYLQPASTDMFRLTAPDVGLREVAFDLSESGTVTFQTPSPSLETSAAFVKAAVETVAQQVKLAPAHITISSAEFFYQNTTTKLGLGSSAAVSVALIGALLQWAGSASTPADAFKMQVLERALAAHHRAQGKQGSGVDIAASTFGGILKYTMPVVSTQLPPEIQALLLPPKLYMRFVWTRTAASTTGLVARVNHFRERNPAEYNRLFGELIYLAEQGSMAFQRGDTEAFLEVVQHYFLQLKALSHASGAPIISDVHQRLHEIARRHHVAYKPSGAGEGDFGILFGSNELNVIDASVEMEKAGFPLFSFQIDENGVQINSERGE